MSKIVVLGLSGFDSEMVGRWLEDLPHLKRLQKDGIWGKMGSTVPPSIPTAWTCAQSSRNPGVFGFWDFSYRDDFSYGEPKVVGCTMKDQRVDCLYKILPSLGQKVAVIGIPVTWPPPRIPGGYSVSSLMKPDVEKSFTWPRSLADEVHNVAGEYILDASEEGVNYRQMERDEAIKRIYDMDLQRFTVLSHFIGKKQCDCVFMVVTGARGIGQLFFRFVDEQHRRYDPDPKFKNVLHDYYVWVDEQIGKVRDALDGDTVLLVHGDHGIQRLDGYINLNEWLIQEGYMVLHEYPSTPTPFAELKIDWAKTKAWVTGHAGQLYLNVQGREPEGTVEPEDYSRFMDELIDKMKAIPNEKGQVLETRIIKRNEIYTGPFADYAPDLFVFFDEGRWKINSMVGYGSGNIYCLDNPFGENDVAEEFSGYFCLAGPGILAKGERAGASLIDVAPTVLDVMDLEIPEEMEGTSLSRKERTAEEKKALLQKRLRLLGY